MKPCYIPTSYVLWVIDRFLCGEGGVESARDHGHTGLPGCHRRARGRTNDGRDQARRALTARLERSVLLARTGFDSRRGDCGLFRGGFSYFDCDSLAR